MGPPTNQPASTPTVFMTAISQSLRPLLLHLYVPYNASSKPAISAILNSKSMQQRIPNP
jgi:hypothetical protein